MKDAAAPQSVPHASPKWNFWEAAAAMQSRTSWWVAFKNIVMGWRAIYVRKELNDEQTGQVRRFPASTKTEGKVRTTKLVSRKGGKAIRVDWWATVPATRFLRFSCCLPGSSRIPPDPLLTRCSESEDSSGLNSRIYSSNSLCFFYVFLHVSRSCPMYCTLSPTVCTCKPCQQSKPHQCNRFFFAGSWPLHSSL